MSPGEIKMILHIYALVSDYRDEHCDSITQSEYVTQAFRGFEDKGLIEKIIGIPEWNAIPREIRRSQYRTTDKGDAFVAALCAVDIPVIKWVQP